MKRALIRWIRSKWNGHAKSPEGANVKGHDLTLYRFNSCQDLAELNLAMEAGWLSFMAFRDTLHDDRY